MPVEQRPEHPVRNAAEAKQLAKFHAGLILEATLSEGWGSDNDQVRRYGTEGAALVEDALSDLAEQLGRGARVG